MNINKNILQEYAEFSPKWHKEIYEIILKGIANYLKFPIYNEVLTDYHNFRKSKSKSGITITLWDLGSGLIDWTQFDSFKEIRNRQVFIKWYRLDKGYKQGDIKRISINNVEFIPICQDLYPESFDVNGLEKLRRNINSNWPDIIIAKHFFSRIEGNLNLNIDLNIESIIKIINFYYHCIEPGGLFIISDVSSSADFNIVKHSITEKRASNEISDDFADYWFNGLCLAKNRSIERAIKKCFGEIEQTINHNFIHLETKISNMFVENKIKKTPRKLAFSATNDLYKDLILKTVEKLNLKEEHRILDVGVGDGRFSSHLKEISKLKKWEYCGLDIIKKQCEIEGVRWECNFFALKEQEKYSAVFLIFMLHLYKHWELMIHKAYDLLAPNGYLVIAFRDDHFAYWRYGILGDNFNSPVKSKLMDYWEQRKKLGIRNYDLLLNATYAFHTVNFAEEMGFKVLEVIKVNKVGTIKITHEDILPNSNALRWSFPVIGVSNVDIENLKKRITHFSVSDDLYESVVAYILQKV